MSEYDEALEDVRDEPVDEPGTDLIHLPDGQLINLTDMAACARALEDLRDLASMIHEAKGAIVDAVERETKRQGTKTLLLENGNKLELRTGTRLVWDAQQLETDLREAGMPEERIREIVVEEVSYTVAAVKANQAARANPVYAKAVERSRSEIETRPTVAIKA